MKRVVITGATGAIGTALINVLIQNNIEVLVIAREDSERNANIPVSTLVSTVYCDLNNYRCCENPTKKSYDVFYHLAWSGTMGKGRDDMYLQNKNVEYALDAVNLAKRLGCRTFIGIGSQAEYGRFNGDLKPDTPANPESGYGIAKLCAGQMTRCEAKRIGINHIWVRVLSVYGPNDNPNSMVMSTINKLKNNIVPEFTKGEQQWDYLYSYDAAQALLLLGEKGRSGKTYVLGSGTVRLLKDYIYDIKNAVNPSCEINLGKIPYGENQVMHLKADISELTKDTGFVPKWNFNEAISKMIRSENL